MKFVCGRSGQSLIEVVVGLAIGAMLIGAASFAISQTLQANLSIQKSQSAVTMSQELLAKVRAYGLADWQNVYTLTKGSSTQYFLHSSGTSYVPVLGKEGLLDTDVTNGLAGQWRFDEVETSTSTTTYDASGNGNDGTLTNSPVRSTSTCRIGNCLSFDGTNRYVNLGTLDFWGTGQQTFSAWIKPSSNAPSVRGFVFAHAGSPTNNRFYIIQMTTGNILFQGGDLSTYTILQGVEYSAGDWIHIVVIRDYDSATLNAYVNGVQKITNQSAVFGSTSQYGNNIGAIAGSETFNGSIDDVRIYNRALSADEVTQLYKSNIFTRHFYVENACRTNDASSSISGVSPCESITPASSLDPSTQKVTAVTEWPTRASTGRSALSDFLTRSRNVIFRQTDWSGGVDGGTVTAPAATFTTSTNVDSGSGGSIRIEGM